MSVASLRQEARDSLRHAAISPYRVTLLALLLLNAVLIPYNVFNLLYAEATASAAGGLDAIGRVGRYEAWITVSPLLFLLISYVWDAAYTGYCLALSRDPNAGLGALLAALRQLGRVIWLCVLVLLFIFLWMCLFVIPGLVALYRYRFSFQLLFDHPEYSALDAIRASKQLTYGYKSLLFLLDLSYFYYYALVYASSLVANFTYVFNLFEATLQNDLIFYLAGTALLIVVQTFWLPSSRSAQIAAYHAIVKEDQASA